MTDDAFTQGILSLRETLYRISYGLLRQEQDRYDAVQETLAKAWEKRRSLREDRLLKTWIIRILINECHNIHRRDRRTVPLHSLAPPDAAAQSDAIEDIELRDALLLLPETLRLPVMLHYMEGYSIQEMATLLKLPPGTVGTRLHRARAVLRDTIGWEE